MSLAQSAVFLFSCPISIVIRVLLIEVIVASKNRSVEYESYG